MIAIIPARVGSTRIPKKNIKEFHGKPIIQYSIETAEKSGLFEEIIVTTDSDEITNKCKGTLIIRRGLGLNANEVGTQEVIKDTLKQIIWKGWSFDKEIVCCIYATSPLLSVEDLARGLVLLKSNRNMQYSFSVGTSPLRDAGNFYWGRREAFLADIPVHGEYSIMVPIDEARVCDINTMDDWVEAEEKYRRLHGH